MKFHYSDQWVNIDSLNLKGNYYNSYKLLQSTKINWSKGNTLKNIWKAKTEKS